MSLHVGNWQLDSLSGGEFWLDGGVVFGIVPKSLWSTVAEPDEQNRIRIACNCVLARDGRQTILLDTGYGSKFAPLDRRFYSMDPGNPVLDSLARLGVAPEAISRVVLSHLHFDHVGGATYYDANRRLLPTFPQARHTAGSWEWADAVSGAPELQTAYSPDNLAPLADAGLVDLIGEQAEIAPGLRARLTGGHTRGHLAIVFESAGQGALFIGDLCATRAHLHPMWNLSYDTFPLDTRRVKPELLREAARREWWVIWPHDPQIVAGRIQEHPKRGFSVMEGRAAL